VSVYLRVKINLVQYEGALTARRGDKVYTRSVEPANNRERYYIMGLRCIITYHAK